MRDFITVCLMLGIPVTVAIISCLIDDHFTLRQLRQIKERGYQEALRVLGSCPEVNPTTKANDE